MAIGEKPVAFLLEERLRGISSQLSARTHF